MLLDVVLNNGDLIATLEKNQMEGTASAGAGQREQSRKDGKRTKASKARELFEEEVKRLAKLIDVKLSQGARPPARAPHRRRPPPS